eukprot:m.523536 g.523536  ORF g.523536 m.523536 type:complete len:95 (-) comp21977_c1_seq18:1325-1609(-)
MERFTAFLPDCNKVVTVCTWLLHTAQRIQEPSTNGSADFTDRDLETRGSTLSGKQWDKARKDHTKESQSQRKEQSKTPHWSLLKMDTYMAEKLG